VCPITDTETQFQASAVEGNQSDRAMPDAVVDVAGKDISEANVAEEKVGLFAKFRWTKKDGKETGVEPAEGPKALPPVPFLKLFRFTTRSEKFMMMFGAACSFLHGAVLPLFTVVFGSVLETLSKPNPKGSQLVSEIGGVAKVWLISGDEAAVVCSYGGNQRSYSCNSLSFARSDFFLMSY
jgi:hypothetical protein